MPAAPLRIISSSAPIRVCDNGGWTDTWFSRRGKVFHIAVSPFAEAQVAVYPRDAREERIVILAENYGDRYGLPASPSARGRHPLLEAVIDYMRPPEDAAFEIAIFSDAPSGAATGTSAAIAVALVAALDRLTPGRLRPRQIAYAAHAVETERLQRQSGIQDQLAATFGGINFIDIREYPEAMVVPIQIAPEAWWELEHRLALIYLGKSHDSSAMHAVVIRDLAHLGPDCRQLEDLRRAAEASRDAILRSDFGALGAAMRENCEAQARLHPGLVCRSAERVFEIARAHGAEGWKVNGAGGEGGSVTILCGPRADVKRAMIQEIEAESSLFKNIPIRLSHDGVRVWESRD